MVLVLVMCFSLIVCSNNSNKTETSGSETNDVESTDSTADSTDAVAEEPTELA